MARKNEPEIIETNEQFREIIVTIKDTTAECSMVNGRVYKITAYNNGGGNADDLKAAIDVLFKRIQGD